MPNYTTVATPSGRGFNSVQDGIYLDVKGLDKALKKLERLKHIDRAKAKQFKRGIKNAAKPLVVSVKSVIKDSNRDDQSKKVGKGYARVGEVSNRARNPEKRKVKTVNYKPGNLRRSIAFFPSRRKGALLGYVGARVGKRAGKTFDGYYAAIVNYGQRRGAAKASLENKRNVAYSIKGHQKGKSQAEAQLFKEVQKILKKSVFELATR